MGVSRRLSQSRSELRRLHGQSSIGDGGRMRLSPLDSTSYHAFRRITDELSRTLRSKRRGYGSFLSFKDPDGNTWLVQEVRHTASH